MFSRRMFIKGACGSLLGTMAVGGYSYLLEPRWVEIKRVTIKINALPKQFDGITIAQMSDIHHSKYVHKEFVRKCVRALNALNPDIIALTGDYVYCSDEFLCPVTEELAELRAKEGVFAVLGNHDCRDSTSDALAKEGIRVLNNEHTPLYRKNDYIFIGGVDNLCTGHMDLKKTLLGMDDNPKVLLCHNPDAIEEIRKTNVDFVMAGHTHGGQVSLPIYGPPVVYSKFGNRYASGLFHEGNTIMYVNKGIGVSVFPVRFFARPEITLFTLRNSVRIV